jgi:integration host factor subunit beta|tara:strand:+ start:2966 stop:3250 length:285 start_codon:yes stop_codon:yes gene_type:complete
MKMKKTDFIEIISDNCKLPRSESKRSIEVILEQLSVAIVSGKGVEIRGFGGFYKRHRESRIGINPKTGEKTQVKEKFVPFFKPGKRLKEAVNNG